MEQRALVALAPGRALPPALAPGKALTCGVADRVSEGVPPARVAGGVGAPGGRSERASARVRRRRVGGELAESSLLAACPLDLFVQGPYASILLASVGSAAVQNQTSPANLFRSLEDEMVLTFFVSDLPRAR